MATALSSVPAASVQAPLDGLGPTATEDVRLRAWLLLGGATGMAGQPTGMAGMALEVFPVRWLNLGLELRTDTLQERRAGAGKVRAWVNGASALIGLLPRIWLGELTVGVGGGLDRVEAWSEGFEQTSRTSFLRPALRTRIAWSHPLFAGASGQLFLDGHLRFAQDVFEIDPVGPVLVLEPFRLSTGVGFGWTFF